ncbi:hypothetical protein [uncultured Lacinutrix sp.]|uniref:hypothetical protein n=1 Tax=uncultured Lacinutrix sp. TaxID=574032 RepID=UPI00262530A5|nr:hypothetical protein [uncultured Lacinutrix sp.]
MIERYKTVKDWFFLYALIGLLLLGCFIQLNNYTQIAQLILAACIPLFVLHYLVLKVDFSLLYIAIIVLLFIAIVIGACRNKHYVFDKISPIITQLGYLCFVFLSLKSYKSLDVKGFTGFYFLFVFLVNLILTLLFFTYLSANMSKVYDIVVLGSGCVIFILLGFLSYSNYLKDGEKKSLLFVFMVLSFAAAEINFHIDRHYLSNIMFKCLDYLFYISGIYFMFAYMKETSDINKKI